MCETTARFGSTGPVGRVGRPGRRGRAPVAGMAIVFREMLPSNRRLAFRRQPHLLDDTGSVGVWITQPAGMVVQLLRETVATGEAARFISVDAYQKLVGVMRPGERAFFIYDMALMVRYESEARVILTQWGSTCATRSSTSSSARPRR